MTTTELLAKSNTAFAEWLREVFSCYESEALFNADIAYYSYASAYEEGYSPREAYDDCRNWMKA